MKTIITFLAIIFFASCSSPKKTAAKAPAHKVTKKDIMKGGTSMDNPIVIQVEKESEGVKEEFRWLSQSYPGYSLIRKTQTTRGNRHYDIITFKTRNGIEKIAYFDITSFWGKR